MSRVGEIITMDDGSWCPVWDDGTPAPGTVLFAEQPEQGEAMAAPNWQPIETAPKDGTTILLTAPGRVTVGEWHPEQWPTASEYHGTTGEYLGQYETGECKPASWISWDGGFFDEDPPTHWMPLPEPPK